MVGRLMSPFCLGCSQEDHRTSVYQTLHLINLGTNLIRPDLFVIGFQEIVPLTAQQILQTDPEQKYALTIFSSYISVHGYTDVDGSVY